MTEQFDYHPKIQSLDIEIYADGADIEGIKELYKNSLIKGFTTNPTLMKKSGIQDYEKFGRELLATISDRPVSLEVFADDFDEMIEQAEYIASWGGEVNIKIPVTNTKGEFSGEVIKTLSAKGIILNVTAILTLEQVQQVVECLHPDTPAIISVFAGRIADTGVDPVDYMKRAMRIVALKPKAKLLWASPRELLNIFQANDIGCHIITVTHDMLKKLSLVGKDLNDYSQETVQMFYNDATVAGYEIVTEKSIA